MMANRSFSSCVLEPCPFSLPVGERLVFANGGREKRFSIVLSPGVQVAGLFGIRVLGVLGSFN